MAKKKFEKRYFNGWVYIMKLWLNESVVYKIGTTNRSVLTRLGELAIEYHMKLGYVPKMKIMKDKQTKDNYAIEAKVLKRTEKNRYYLDCNTDVCGESELRKMDEAELFAVYEECIATDYPAVTGVKVEL